jgi:hypothetical protein
MSYGTVWLEDGSSVEVHSAQDWAWIQLARRQGKKYVVSCADRFNMPADYFCAYAADDAELARIKADLRRPMTDILAVFAVGPERPAVRNNQRGLLGAAQRWLTGWR